MISSVKEILAMLLAGKCDAQQAEAWINEHIELAGERADLRDMFASCAITGLQASTKNYTAEGAASYAFEIADRMLEARDV